MHRLSHLYTGQVPAEAEHVPEEMETINLEVGEMICSQQALEKPKELQNSYESIPSGAT